LISGWVNARKVSGSDIVILAGAKPEHRHGLVVGRLHDEDHVVTPKRPEMITFAPTFLANSLAASARLLVSATLQFP
jgi:hypothetical protein